MYKQLLTIIILLLLLPLMAFSQSRQSNKLYKQGLELFKAEKYEDAIPYFQKSDSLDKATMPPTSNNYFRAELKLADCMDGIADSLYNADNYAEAIKFQKLSLKSEKRR